MCRSGVIRPDRQHLAVGEVMPEIFEGSLRNGSTREEVRIEAAARFVVGALLGLLTRWLDHEAPADPDAPDKIFRTLVSGGTKAAPGTEP
jgi:hypothetical protein